MITGTVRVDLTDAKPENMRHRAAALATAPAGCRVVLVVGPLAVEPEAVRVLRGHADRLDIEVQGQSHAVKKWVTALREGVVVLL